MKRRDYLKGLAISPIVFSQPVSAVEANLLNTVSDGYFEALPDTEAQRHNAIVNCATQLCQARQTVSKAELDAVVNGGEAADHILRRLKFGVRILNENRITNKIKESHIESGRRNLEDKTKYIPLARSFNELTKAACEVQQQTRNSEAVKNFLVASLAFGMEVALWVNGAPYRIAWRGTRYVANRTFLRFARSGCQGCIALAMSELHWAIRGSIYGEVINKSEIEFVWQQIQTLQKDAARWGYDNTLDYTLADIRRILNSDSAKSGGGVVLPPSSREGPIEQFLPDLPRLSLPDFDFPEFKLPDIPSLSDYFG